MRWCARFALLACLLMLTHRPSLLAVTPPDESLHGFPVLRDVQGKKLADGDFSQWKVNGRLHIRITYEFGKGRRSEERAVFREQPLAQESWSFLEEREGKPYRQFEIDFQAGKATARKLEKGTMKTYSKDLD